MSKRRQRIPEFTNDLTGPPADDLAPYVIFTQLKEDGPYVYAGWVDAVDDEMALGFGREHYGQDQACVHLWAIERSSIARSEEPDAADQVAGERRAYVVFAQQRNNDQLTSIGVVEATSGGGAIDAAGTLGIDAAERLWAAPRSAIAATNDDEIIWRLTDQSYRLARGYSKAVREKWEKIRERPALEEYEKEELTEMFE